MPASISLLALGLLCSTAISQNSLPLQSSPISWKDGPCTVSLGDKATLNVPLGYRFTGKDAADFLRGNGNSIPKGLLGCLASTDGGLLVVFEFDDIGFLKDPVPQDLKPDEVLKVLATRAQLQAKATSTTWEMPPKYDAAAHTFEWAIKMEIGNAANSRTVRNYSAGLIARRGVLTTTTVSQGPIDIESLRSLNRTISFRPDQAFGAFAKGDKQSNLSMAQFLTKEQQLEKAGQTSRLMLAGQIAFWGGVALFVIASTVALALMVRRGRQTDAVAPANIAKPASASVVSAKAQTPVTPAAPATAQATPSAPATAATKAAQPRPATPAPITAKPRPTFIAAKSLNGATKRKREFDYNRYFADLMSTVSGHGAMNENPSANGYQMDIAQLMQSPMSTNGSAGGTNPAFNANSELIANQTTLIEEQRRLIQEQTKLIEEKSRLIAEKNQLLKIQRELMENKIL